MTLRDKGKAGKNINLSGGDKSAAKVYDLSSSEFSLPFFHYFTIPKNTAITSPLTYEMTLPIGMIKKLWVEFPRGCAGLVGVRLFRGVQQIFPLPADVWLKTDNALMPFSFTHVVKSEPFKITITGYNNDDTYDHTIWFAFEMSGLKKDLPSDMQAFIEALQV